MKIRYFITIFIFLAIAGFISAQEGVVFPVVELGGCGNFQECADFCDKAENFKVCTDFAEIHGMVKPEQAGETRHMLEIIEQGGPGNCQTQKECDIYCDKPEHMEECIIFGKEHGLIPASELKDAEAVLQAIQLGIKPPPCAGKEECDIYCSESEHLDECLTFGIAAGFIEAEEAEMVRKTGGKGPGGCRGKKECDIYCNIPENMEECINFGIKYGMMPQDEIEDAKMMLEAIKKGVKPPACGSSEECDAYCSQPEHMEECTNFAVAAGFMTAEEAKEGKKMTEGGMMGGPGGCKDKEECEAFCDNPDHMQECMKFAEKYGLMPDEEIEKFKKIQELGETKGPGGCKNQQECDAYCSDEEHQQECFEFGVKMGFIGQKETDRMRKMEEVGPNNRGPGGCETQAQCEYICSQPQYMEECMNYSKDKGLMSEKDVETVVMMGPGGPGGPGGCRGEAECEEYCSKPEHMEECTNFAVEQGFLPLEEAEKMRIMIKPPEQVEVREGEVKTMPAPEEKFIGLPGCGTPEECVQYCSQPEHFEECRQWKGPPPEGMPFEEKPPEEMIKQEQMMPGEYMTEPGMVPQEEWIETKPMEKVEDMDKVIQEEAGREREVRMNEAMKNIMPEMMKGMIEETVEDMPKRSSEYISESMMEMGEMLPGPEETMPMSEPFLIEIIPEIKPVEEPQTFFDVAQNFLASFVSSLGF